MNIKKSIIKNANEVRLFDKGGKPRVFRPVCGYSHNLKGVDLEVYIDIGEWYKSIRFFTFFIAIF